MAASRSDHRAKARVEMRAAARAGETSGGHSGRSRRTPDDTRGALALYITGPDGGSRHLLPPSGLVTLGRSDACAFVLGDPQASRTHAAIHLGETVMLSDLGSANGTFLGEDRLRAGEPRALASEQKFFIGDLALCVRPTGLHPLSPERILGWEQLLDGLDSRPANAGAGWVLLRAKTWREDEISWLEAGVGDLLAATAGGWLVRLGGGHLVLAVPVEAPDAAESLERSAIERLGRRAIAAEVETMWLPSDADELRGSAVAFLLGGRSPRTRRGMVILRDPGMEEIQRAVVRVAPASHPVLLLGETGVGKGAVASMLHELSPRAERPYQRLHCAALPETLIEGELFGHDRGASAGADRSGPGLIEVADGGTVFLDEVGALTLRLQAELLVAIERQEVTRRGGSRPRAIDVRFVAGSSRDLGAEVEAGRFRRDLFQRLAGVTLEVPPLRARRSEIEPLARSFLDGARARFGLGAMSLSRAAIAALETHRWPGNVRELRTVVERTALLAGSQVHEPGHLGLGGGAGGVGGAGPEDSSVTSPGGVLSERARIEAALKHCGGNQRRAAELLGIPLRTLVRRIAELGVLPPGEPRGS
jgi:DNA-binding NtrC family response regulator